LETIAKAEIVDSSPVRGCNVIRPYGYAIWENMVAELDRRIKEDLGAQNAYFPLLIPESFLKKEKEHVEGFSPELAVVTHAGGSKLDEPYVIRPTSETAIYDMFSRWISSYRDLPLKINQWANVVRWEMRPRAFLRTTEFLWQEGHTAHATEAEARKMAIDALEMYRDFTENFLAVPVYTGEKTEHERFAGAKSTFAIEALMRNGKALQWGTTHLLAHSFPKAFGIKFNNEQGETEVPWCSSWGVSTRMIGGIIMAHGDKFGLVLPPKIAPIQVVIVPIVKKGGDNAAVLEQTQKIHDTLKSSGIRVYTDVSDNKTPGSKFFDYERKGVPLRIELGSRDLDKGTAVLVRRIEIEGKERKQFIPFDALAKTVTKELDVIHDAMLASATAFKKANTHMASDNVTFEQLKKDIEDKRGLHQVGWCKAPECELRLKEAKAFTRIVIGKSNPGRKCFACEAAAQEEVLVARAY
ncbi:proline--tRNA ligase, partial [Candidatus Babeliales bacterium]|nr:proline--tRNA ligase [Candidatus Babeliales bacterium]